jgi:hypothetical protein
LGTVTRKLGIAKDQRVPPAKLRATAHVSVLLRLNCDLSRYGEGSSEDSETEPTAYDYSLLRIQRCSYATSVANKQRNYPNLEVIREWETPNSMNIWHRYRDKYGHRIFKCRNDFTLRENYSEPRMIRHVERIIQSRLVEDDLE